ncbi:MAG: 50S ribosomal protein L23 [Candidatus Zophobacter franzmannii]|jgi:large subunit ribosomal protein L23|nr:50S ribosomal protein L23 [Candidatus Zophobacter franzmannii]
MIHPREIIIAPIITEKTGQMKESDNRYTFKVSINANKIEIRRVIEQIFNVKVVAVNTIRYKGKPKRLGRYEGFKPDWKKAIVTLAEGQSIPDFEL